MSTTTVTGINYAKANLSGVIRGSKFGPITLTYKANGVAIDLTGANIDIWFRRENANGKEILKIDETSGITISDPTNGIFYIDAFSMNWIAGTYYYDVRVLESGETIPLKYIYGYIEVKEDSTNES
jgi:hypothetical protein